jgi:D-amino-acid dehydrogenase
MDRAEDIVVIGGGIIGVCAAYYLAAEGRSVTLLEKQDICAGASYGNAGLIVPSHAIPMPAPGVLSAGLRWLLDPESPFYIRPRLDFALFNWLRQFRAHCREGPMLRGIPTLLSLGVAGMPLFQELVARNTIDCGFDRKGWLLLFKSSSALEKASREAELLGRFGVRSRLLDAAGVRGMEENLSPALVGGIYFPEEAHLVPDRFTRGLAACAAKMGAVLKTGTEVLGFETSGQRISRIVTTRGECRPDHVILAAGAWSPSVSGQLPIRMPVQAAKGYSINIKTPAGGPRVPLYLTERKVAVTPMGDVLRFSGTLELSGLDLAVDRRRVAAIARAAGEYMSGCYDMQPLEIWRGLRPVTPDGLPIIGRSEAVENLVIATGHGMMGVTFGPITGRLVSDLVTGREPELDIAPFRPERFAD